MGSGKYWVGEVSGREKISGRMIIGSGKYRVHYVQIDPILPLLITSEKYRVGEVTGLGSIGSGK